VVPNPTWDMKTTGRSSFTKERKHGQKTKKIPLANSKEDKIRI